MQLATRNSLAAHMMLRFAFRIYDEPGNLIETHEHAGDYRE